MHPASDPRRLDSRSALKFTPVATAIALVLASAGWSAPTWAADDLATLQAENARLRLELEALKKSQAPASQETPAAAATAAPAQEAAPVVKAGAKPEASLGMVVVTSRNREEIAQNIPLPVQVIGGDQLDRDGAKSIWDLPGKAPNLQINPPGENARKVSISIRGIGRNGANDSAEGSVGVIVDGVTLYYAGQAWTDYVDLDRVEVLRGPQGTLMGKNTTLGAVNIVTKAPSFVPSSSFELAGGSQNDISGKFSTTGPLVPGLLAYRGTVVVDRANGLYTNTYQSFGSAKETWNETNKVAGRFQVLWTPSTDLSGRFIVDKLRSDERVNLGFQYTNGPSTWADGTARPTVNIPAGYTGAQANYGYLGKFASRAQWFHNADGTVYQPRLGSTDFGNSEARPQVTNQWGGSAEFKWNVADHTLTSITAYRYQDFDIKNGGNFDQFYITNSGQQLWNKQLSQELRIASTPAPDKAVDYQAGLYYLKARVYSDDPTYYGQDAGAWLASNSQYNTLIATATGRELLRASLDGMYQSSVTDARVRSLAGYTQADWHLTEQATLTGGVRVTREHKSNRISQQLDRAGIALNNTNFSQASNAELTAANAIRNAQITPAYGFVDGEPIDATLVAWNLSPSYQLDRDVLLYTSAGRGVKSGVVTWATGTTTPQNLGSERSLDFELGFKSLLLDRTVQFNLNLYQTKISDYQTSLTFLNSDNTTTTTQWVNAPGVKARGLELESAWRASSNLSFNATGAFNRAVYDGPFSLSKPEAASGLVDLNGKQLYNAPKFSFNLGANYLVPLLDSYLGRVTVSSSYRSGTYLQVNQSELSYQGGYNLVNVGLGFGPANHDWEFSLNGKNVLDRFYATSKSTYTGTGAGNLQLGAPVYWGVAFKSKL